MRVTLAYPYRGHAPDETVDLPRAEARRLLVDGVARRAPKPVAPPAQPEPAEAQDEPAPIETTPKPSRSRGNTSEEQQ